MANSCQACNTDRTTDPASGFAYWTDPIFDTPPLHPEALAGLLA